MKSPNTDRKSSESDDCFLQTNHTLSESSVLLVWFPSSRTLFIDGPNTASKASEAHTFVNVWFRVSGYSLGFRVYGFGLRVEGARFNV